MEEWREKKGPRLGKSEEKGKGDESESRLRKLEHRRPRKDKSRSDAWWTWQ